MDAIGLVCANLQAFTGWTSFLRKRSFHHENIARTNKINTVWLKMKGSKDKQADLEQMYTHVNKLKQIETVSQWAVLSSDDKLVSVDLTNLRRHMAITSATASGHFHWF